VASGKNYRADSRDIMPAPRVDYSLVATSDFTSEVFIGRGGIHKMAFIEMPWRSAGSDGEQQEPS
jgi:hypothetical protein